MPKLLRVEEVAERLGLKVPTVRLMIAKGDLPSVHPTRRAIRVREEDVEALIRVGYRPRDGAARIRGGIARLRRRAEEQRPA
jgi:excisionase family DNA binding protein